jgi:CelD/BcsL family acetyltransferase involved in cellulose biosynthesis
MKRNLPNLLPNLHVINTRSGSADTTTDKGRWTVAVINELPRLSDFADTWDRLLTQNATHSYFLRYSWARLWLLHLAPSGHALFVLLVRDPVGEVRGLAPFYIAARRFALFFTVPEVMFIGTGTAVKTSEHLDILAQQGSEVEVARAIADFLLQHNNWQRLFLWNVSERSPTLLALRQSLRGRLSPCDRPHVVSTAGTWDDIAVGWSKKFRYNLDRSAKLLTQQMNASFRTVRDRSELAARFADFVRLHQLRWTGKGRPGSFADLAVTKFCQAAVFDAFDQNSLRFWCCERDGRCIATLIAFVDGGVAHYFQSGFDPAFSKFSLGSAMIAHCLKDCVADPGILEFDFMGGGALYKDSWTTQTRTALQFETFRTRRIAMLFYAVNALREFARTLKRSLRRGRNER